jgi:hypothetical protein
MTVEHHHKTNDSLLTQSLNKVVEFAKTPPSRTTWLVLICLLLAATLVGVWFYFTGTAAAASSALWTKLDLSAGDDLQKFAHDQENTVQGRYARLMAARRDMQAVAQLGNLDREEAARKIEDARAIYQKLEQEAGDTPALMQESLMGAAKTNEILGDLDKARHYYDRLANEYPKTALGQEAKDRRAALDDPDTKEQIQTLAAELAAPK